MVQTREGDRKTAQTIKEKWGSDFYREIGRKGGKNGHTGGFASNVIGRDGLTGKERARIAGRKGGTISKRKKYSV
jgi:general stress protein YciG